MLRKLLASVAALGAVSAGMTVPSSAFAASSTAPTDYTITATDCSAIKFDQWVNLGDTVTITFDSKNYPTNRTPCQTGSANTFNDNVTTRVFTNPDGSTRTPAVPTGSFGSGVWPDGKLVITAVGAGDFDLSFSTPSGGVNGAFRFSVRIPPKVPITPTVTVSGTTATISTARSDSGAYSLPTKFNVTASPGDGTCSFTPSQGENSCTISNLQPGAYTFTATAENSAGISDPSAASVSVGVNGPPVLTKKTPSTSGTVDAPFTPYTFAATGYPAPKFDVEWGSGSLPPGLTLDQTTGLLSGKPTKAGVYSFKVKATNTSGDDVSELVTITIASPPAPAPAPGPASPPTATPTPTPTPTPTTVSNLGPELPGSNPNIPAGGVPLGGSVYLVNGQPVPITVKPDAPKDATGLDVFGDGFTMRLVGRTTNDKPLGLTPDGALILEQDRSAYTEGTGFKPNSEVKLYVFSEPRFLGNVMTDANGSFRGSVPLPLDIQAGRHTLQSNGLAPDGAVRSLSLGVQVQAPVVKTVKTRTAKATVYFDALSATLDASDKKSLRALAVGRSKVTTKIVAVGYVQPTRFRSNDKALSLQRAQAVAAYLKSIGVKGVVVTRGDGVAEETGAAGRKAIITITYNQ